MTDAERATLAYIDSQIRQTESDARHLDAVVANWRTVLDDPSLGATERKFYEQKLTGSLVDVEQCRRRLDDWKRVRDDVAQLFDPPPPPRRRGHIGRPTTPDDYDL